MTNINIPNEINDETVHQLVQEVVASDLSNKFDVLDGLTYIVWNYHSDGMCAHTALNEISSAIDKVLGL